MAVDDDELVVRLSLLEKAESAHRDVHVGCGAIMSVPVREHPAAPSAAGGSSGRDSLGRSSAIGTFELDGRRVLADVHRDAGRGVRVTLDQGSLHELVLGWEPRGRRGPDSPG